MQAIGLDLGSSTIKAAVLDLDGHSIGKMVQVPFPGPIPGLPPLHYEVDPDAVVVLVERLVRELLDSTSGCSALFCSTQMGGLVLADAHRTRRTHYISWRDQRVVGNNTSGGTDLDRLRSRLTEPLIRRLGNEFRPGNPLSLLAWLSEQGALPAAPVTALGIGEYVLMKLCGNDPVFHLTQTAGMLDLSTRDWCHEALDLLGVGAIRCPSIVDLRNPIGEWNVDGTRLACFAAVGDHPCALAGAGLRKEELSINISTGSQVSVRTLEVRPGPDYQTRPYFDGDWLNTITHLPAGRSLNALVALLSELSTTPGEPLADVWDRIGRRLEEVPESDLAMSLNFFPGPAGERGRIENISLDNLTVGHLFRAAVNNMADNYSKAAGALADGARWERLLFSGGLAQKLKGLPETISARFGIPSRLAQVGEEALQGLLELAIDSCNGQGSTVAHSPKPITEVNSTPPPASARFMAAMEALDAANAADPCRETVEGRQEPKELLYARRMTQWLQRLEPNASEALRLAARAQHVCRWMIPRSDYPRTRTGYIRWRTTLGKFHADKAARILKQVGYEEPLVGRVESLIRKAGLGRDEETQTLEDVACLVFIENYFPEFEGQHAEEKIIGIIRKTWKKMSPRARAEAIKLPLPPRSRSLVETALASQAD